MPEKSIAALPFTDMSEKKDQEYFADGMAEEILDLLAKIRGLTVIGHTSSFQFKGKNMGLRTIGTQLNAACVLEGSIRKSGAQVRITAHPFQKKVRRPPSKTPAGANSVPQQSSPQYFQ